MKEKILVVEDEEAILIGIVDLLKSEGFKVKEAKNGKDAIFLYNNEKPDLIILDIMIPEINGYDVCKEIRKNDQLTPIIMLTAKGQELDKVIGLELGADDYVVKPFGIHELLARIRAVLRRKNAKPINSSFTISLKFPRLNFLGNIVIPPRIVSIGSFKAIANVLINGYRVIIHKNNNIMILTVSKIISSFVNFICNSYINDS